jgi:hypothetical protein
VLAAAETNVGANVSFDKLSSKSVVSGPGRVSSCLVGHLPSASNTGGHRGRVIDAARVCMRFGRYH